MLSRILSPRALGLLLSITMSGTLLASSNVVSKIDKEIGAATTAVNNPAVSVGASVQSAVLQTLSSDSGKTQGLQFKDPVISPSGTYRYYHDSSTPAGFGGHDWSGEFTLDADVYDGLITGVFYQRLTRNGSNSTGTSEDMDSDAFSLFVAKRFMELINVGASYNLSITDHNLEGTAVADLDRLSNGFTSFVGASDKLEEWFLSSTLSFTYAHDNYRTQPFLDTGMISWANEVMYDVMENFTAGFGFSYNNYLIQDTFPGVTSIDRDYWTVGPRFRFYPTDTLTVSLDLDTQQDFKAYDSYTVRVGCNYAF